MLQFVWQNLLFDVRDLQTTCGKRVTIEFQGEQNAGDGPDFKKAKVRLDDLWFYGDVELHTQSELWYTHRHHEDPAYNSVILHVVTDAGAPAVRRRDGSLIPSLDLYPRLTESTLSLLRKKYESGRLPCSGQVGKVSSQVIKKQFETSRKAYFDYRTNQLMHFYDASLAPFQAWKRMTAIALFEGYGYSKNRTPMIEFGKLYLDAGSEDGEDHSGLPVWDHQEVLTRAGLVNRHNSVSFSWDFSSTRPANHPQTRLLQATEMVNAFWKLKQKDYVTQKIDHIWKNLLSGMSKPPGVTRAKQLWQAVWLPSIYLMGSLCSSKIMMDKAFGLWLQEKGGVPESILSDLVGAGLDKSNINHPGAVYQYKQLCSAHKCTMCAIMKNLLKG